jgi:hypothetical protein
MAEADGLNPKSECRNPKQIQITEIQMTETLVRSPNGLGRKTDACLPRNPARSRTIRLEHWDFAF